MEVKMYRKKKFRFWILSGSRRGRGSKSMDLSESRRGSRSLIWSGSGSLSWSWSGSGSGSSNWSGSGSNSRMESQRVAGS